MAAKSTSTSSLVPSEVGSGRPIPAATGPSAVVDPTAIVEVNDSQIEDVEPEQEETPMEPYGPNAVEGVEVTVGSVEVAKSSPPKEPIHLNYYARMALEADAQAAAAAAAVAEKAVDPKKENIPKTQEQDIPKEHHILSPYEEKVLTRTEQDALYAEKGGRTKGRGKGRGKGKGKGRGGKGRGGKGRGKGSKTPKSSPAPKPKTRKVKKDPAVRELFRSDDESWQEVPKSQRLKRPAAAKSKVNPKSKAKSEKPKNGKGCCQEGGGEGGGRAQTQKDPQKPCRN